MAKMSRNQLKSLIKECLVEVLVEGLNPGSASSVNLSESRSSSKRKASTGKRRPALDNIVINNRIQESVAMATSDPILSDILADTAATTLQEQIGGDRRESRAGHMQQIAANGDGAARAVSGADPSDLFGEAANNWAALAFSDSEK